MPGTKSKSTSSKALAELEPAIASAEAKREDTIVFDDGSAPLERVQEVVVDIKRVLRPTGRGRWHELDCYVPEQVTKRDLSWVEVQFSDLPPGTQRCRASGGSSG